MEENQKTLRDYFSKSVKGVFFHAEQEHAIYEGVELRENPSIEFVGYEIETPSGKRGKLTTFLLVGEYPCFQFQVLSDLEQMRMRVLVDSHLEQSAQRQPKLTQPEPSKENQTGRAPLYWWLSQ